MPRLQETFARQEIMTSQLADPPLGDAEPGCKVLAGDHRVVGDDVQRPLLSWTDAEGWRSLRHALGTGQRCPLPLRRLCARPARTVAGDHGLQREERAADHERRAAPVAKVLPLQRVPGLHGNVAVVDVPVVAEPRRQPLLPHAGHEDQDGAGATGVAVLGYDL